MPDNTSPTSSYTMGYSDEFRQLLNRRSAETHAFYLMPHLKSGLRVLDFGCGPGTITVGLARAVDPGEVHGIDAEASQIDLARAACVAGGHANATFHVGDVTNMPFEDNFFYVAHCHAVLMHVPDSAAVLAEVKRVLKPRGLLASRESIIASCFLDPVGNNLSHGWDVFGRLLAGNGRQALRPPRERSGSAIDDVLTSPFIPLKDQVRGFIYDCATGQLNEVDAG